MWTTYIVEFSCRDFGEVHESCVGYGMDCQEQDKLGKIVPVKNVNGEGVNGS
jgi:hypothetical protein